MKTKLLLPAALLMFALLSGCTENCDCVTTSPTNTPMTATPSVATHSLKGVIQNIFPEEQSLLIKHEAIPGYMGAMTMAFKVDAATLKAAQKGQSITGNVVLHKSLAWLEAVKLQPTQVP